MKKIILGILLCTGFAFAEPGVPAKDYTWPTSPTRFRIVTSAIDLEWKDGRPFAQRSDLVKMLHISPEGPDSVDLIEALAEKGWYVRTDHNGDIEAINPKIATGSNLDPKTREKNLAAAKAKPAETPKEKKKKPDAPAVSNDPTNPTPQAPPDYSNNNGLPPNNPNNPNQNPNVPHK